VGLCTRLHSATHRCVRYGSGCADVGAKSVDCREERATAPLAGEGPAATPSPRSVGKRSSSGVRLRGISAARRSRRSRWGAAKTACCGAQSAGVSRETRVTPPSRQEVPCGLLLSLVLISRFFTPSSSSPSNITFLHIMTPSEPVSHKHKPFRDR
jgi:hypothetical protein